MNMVLALLPLITLTPSGDPVAQRLSGIVIEAETMELQGGWKAVRVGAGNLLVDQLGSSHISGERLALLPADQNGQATIKVRIPHAGAYVVWVRHEHATGCDASFTVQINQAGKGLACQAGGRLNPAFGPGDTTPSRRRDNPQGMDGLVEERFETQVLEAGEATIVLEGKQLTGSQGTVAPRLVDAIVLTDDLTDSWRPRLSRQTPLYPILDLMRDLAGARWEARFRHATDSLGTFTANHHYNRAPYGASEGILSRDLAPNTWSKWAPLVQQDTCHASMTTFTGPTGGFEVELRPAGSAATTGATSISGNKTARVFIPPYPTQDDAPMTPEEALARIFKILDASPAPGQKPRTTLCLGEHLPVWADGTYGALYAELSMRLFGREMSDSARAKAILALREAGQKPVPDQVLGGGPDGGRAITITKVRQDLKRQGLADATVWYDLGEDTTPASWITPFLDSEVDRERAAGNRTTAPKVLNRLWIDWLEANRGDVPNREYWMGAWGTFDRLRMHPDSSSDAARAAPKLYVDSLIFYEELLLKQVRQTSSWLRLQLGKDTHVGFTTNPGPLYFPTIASIVQPARSGAINFVRTGDGFWRSSQAGPLINGYVTEHATLGLRNQPMGVVRPFNLAQDPGNTDDDFVRSAVSHLAHGATRLDFGGIGLDETFAENHIDHRSATRFRAIRDVTHAIGMVDDLLPSARPVASPVALLVSESTERWDLSGIAKDGGERGWASAEYRKTRMTHHLERLGLYTSLVHQGRSPDLMLESDCTVEKLKNIKLLLLVGDCLPAALAERLAGWVREGGVLMATAGAGRFDPYRKSHTAFDKLLGLKGRLTTEQDTFALPRRGLAQLATLDAIAGPGWLMPVLACHERLEPEDDTLVVARFQGDDSPAVCARPLGRGRVFTVAAYPGMACLWTAMQPASVPDRGPSSHRLPALYDPGAMAVVAEALKAASISPEVWVADQLIDARVLASEKGLIIPLANYGKARTERTEVTLRLPRKVTKATSAWAGPVPLRQEGDATVVVLPSLGVADIIRVE